MSHDLFMVLLVIAAVASYYWLYRSVRNLGKTLDSEFCEFIDERIRQAKKEDSE